jgi:alpha-glucosidase
MAKTQQPKTDQAVPFESTATGERYPDVYHDFSPNQFESMEQDGSRVLLRAANGIHLRVEALADHTLRFRYALEGQFERDFSYLLDPNAAYETPDLAVEEADDHVSIRTHSLICHIHKQGLMASLYDAETNVLLSADAAPFTARRSILHGVEQVKSHKTATPEEAFYGLGDKSCALNLRGEQLQHWNTDSFGYGKDTDPLYRSIPFYFGLREGHGYGIFFHNTHRTHFDFAKSDEASMAFWADGGEMDYFFIHGPQLLDVAQRYAWLTGRPELPPLWALGFHQCRWSYYPEERVYEIAKEFRERQIPCDAIYLDIDYMDGYRCFTWDEEHFPKPKKLIEDLRKDGFQTIVMIDPGIRVDPDYHVYQEGMKRRAFCYRSSGELMRGPVWPTDCVFPDYTKPEVREWWGTLYETLYNEQGVSGFWNDMNEPAVFQVNSATFPENVLHDNDGETCDHRRIHNVYGQQMSRATYEGLKQLQPNKRPFVLTRATNSGGQRFASVWTGDNIASWEHLRLANIQCQRLSISGFSFVGTDVGGFKDQPDGELFLRWMQLAAFHPLYRVHSMGNNVDGAAEADAEAIHEAERLNRMDQEPWVFGEPYTELSKQAIELRYTLLPYLYTTFWQYVQDGRPMIRSLVFADQSNAATLSREAEFMVGDHLLVLPVLEAGQTIGKGYLPAGEWYDYEQGTRFQGRQEVKIECGLERIPLLVKAGAVIPNYPVQQYVGEQQFDNISLRVYHGQSESELYEDAGEGYAYEEEAYCLRNFNTLAETGRFELHQSISGQYDTGYTHLKLQLFGLPFAPSDCSCDGESVAVNKTDMGLEIEVPAGFRRLMVKS